MKYIVTIKTLEAAVKKFIASLFAKHVKVAPVAPAVVSEVKKVEAVVETAATTITAPVQ